MNVLYEDDYILVCEKPAGVATQSAKVTQKDMVSIVNMYVKKAGDTPAYLIHRLDKPVRGILLFAKTKDAAGKLGDAIKNGKMQKHYHALVEGHVNEKSGELNNYILKDSKTNKAVITKEKSNGAKAAKLKYNVTGYKDNKTLLDIELITGRYHQIRAQFSYIGHPVVGDTLYGAAGSVSDAEVKTDSMKQPKTDKIYLTAYRLSFCHPKTNKEMTFVLDDTDQFS